MRRQVGLICGVAIVLIVSGAQAYQEVTVERATKDDAVAMVKKGIAYIKANGTEKAFAAFNDPKGEFEYRDIYLVVDDTTGLCLAHGGNVKLVGKVRIDDEDVNGKFMIKERTELMKTKQSYWQSYKWFDPVTNKIQPKETYCEVVNDPVLKTFDVCSGVYVIKK